VNMWVEERCSHYLGIRFGREDVEPRITETKNMRRSKGGGQSEKGSASDGSQRLKNRHIKHHKEEKSQWPKSSV